MTSAARTEEPVLSREVRLAKTIVYVDGITRAGKSMMGPILASFHRVEIERLEYIIENIGTLYRMGKMTRDAAVALLRIEVDLHLYNGTIGRNTNFRFTDHSSVWRNPNRLRYFGRLAAKEGEAALERIRQEGPVFQNQTHDELAGFELSYEAFGEDLRIVEMVRHPVDLMDSWIRRGWGNRYGEDPLAFTFCIRHGDQDLPYYALGWEDVYLSATPQGRVVRMIGGLWDGNQRTYRSLSDAQKNQVFFVPFENFVQNPTPYLGPLAEFIGTKLTRHTPSALRRQRCPREYRVDIRDQKRRALGEQLSAEEREIVERLVEGYEEVVREVAR